MKKNDTNTVTQEMFNEYKKEQRSKFKKFVIFVVVFCIVISGITGVASYSLAASEVNFSPKDISWNVDNAEAAINDLYYKVPGIPIGTILPFMGNTAPAGYVICDGTEYNISSHINLANFIKDQFGSYDYFGGDGEVTFKVPNLTGKFLKGSNTAGVNEEAGLPNIKGAGISAVHYGTSNTSWVNNGAFKWYNSAWYLSYTKNSSGTHDYEANVEFDASLSNSIYGNSTTVTPENTSVLYIIKY